MSNTTLALKSESKDAWWSYKRSNADKSVKKALHDDYKVVQKRITILNVGIKEITRIKTLP